MLLGAYAAVGVLTIAFFNGTGDDGDSILHYLYARYAPVHPELFLNHWAKPLFVLISAPFAQFGFTGMKIFNLCVSILTFYLTFLTARRIGIKNPLLVILFMIFTPLWYILTFSGLTEPLFALFLIGAVYLAVQKSGLMAAVVVSLMPFVRSEGLIIILVFGIYFMFTKQWKFLPWLAAGHLFFAIAGYFVYHDLLWVFNKIPYASLGPKYGSGPFLHFVYQLNYVAGVPLYILFIVGVISYPWSYLRRKITYSPEEILLFVFGFTAFLLAHSAFWYFGIFNSMGLKRVLLGVLPLICLVALRGFNFITEEIPAWNRSFRPIIGTLLLFYVVIFPFTSNPAAIHWNREMNLTKGQELALGAAAFIRDNPVPKGARLYYVAPYLSEALQIDHFDPGHRLDLSTNCLSSLGHDDRIIWDSWFSPVEANVTLESLDGMAGLKREIDLSSQDEGRNVRLVIFRKE